MTNKLIYFVFALAFLVACKSKRKVISTPDGPLVMLTPKEASKALIKKEPPANWVQIKADVNVEQSGSNQNGRAEIRMYQDSIIWAEIADPIIGFKVLRAFAMADTIAYINRLEKTYFAGPYSYVEQKLGTSIPFPFAFNVFMGQLFSAKERPAIVEEHYIIEETMQDSIRFFAKVEPRFLDCVTQEFYTPKNAIRINYSDYRKAGRYRYPYKIAVQVIGKQNLSASFTVREIIAGSPLEMPFKVSSKYERVD